MTLGELKVIVDALHEIYGDDLSTTFEHKWATGKKSRSDITAYSVSISSIMKQAVFRLDYPRGELING